MRTSVSFQYYKGDIKKISPVGSVTLYEFLEGVKNPKPRVKEKLYRIKEAHESGNELLKADLKKTLPCFTPAVHVKEKRSYDSIGMFTGLMPFDFDKLSKDEAVGMKYWLWDECPQMIACWLSSSGHGVRGFIQIPVVENVSQYKDYFRGFMQAGYEKYPGFDKAPQNCVLPLFYSHDPDIMIRQTWDVWDYAVKEPEKVPLPVEMQKPFDYRYSDSIVKSRIKEMIDKITDNGHPQLRAAAYLLGGYVGNGQINKFEAEAFIVGLIEQNSYLSKKPSTYIRTAKEMIDKGYLEPLNI
jgi:hypothetical protein